MFLKGVEKNIERFECSFFTEAENSSCMYVYSQKKRVFGLVYKSAPCTTF